MKVECMTQANGDPYRTAGVPMTTDMLKASFPRIVTAGENYRLVQVDPEKFVVETPVVRRDSLGVECSLWIAKLVVSVATRPRDQYGFSLGPDPSNEQVILGWLAQRLVEARGLPTK